MTTTIFYHGDAHELAQATSPLLVDVEALGLPITHQQMSTCDMSYCIVDNQLVLRDMLLLETDAIAVGTNVYNGEVYRGLAHRIPYTGKLLIVRDLFQHNILNTHPNPFVNIEAYDTILELTFDDGELVCTINHSQTMSALRSLARKWRKSDSPYDFLANMSTWIQAIYGDDYDVWWLPVAV